MSNALLRIAEVSELRIDGLEDNVVRVRFSKTDRDSKGEYLYLCEDTRLIVQKWLQLSELTESYLFWRMTSWDDNLYIDKKTDEPAPLNPDAVRQIIKSAASWVGITEKISGHSLRIGKAVSLVRAGATVVDMQIAVHWNSPTMPAYYARAQLSEKEAVTKFKGAGRFYPIFVQRYKMKKARYFPKKSELFKGLSV